MHKKESKEGKKTLSTLKVEYDMTPQRTVRTFAQFRTQAFPTHEHRTVGQGGNVLEHPQPYLLEREKKRGLFLCRHLDFVLIKFTSGAHTQKTEPL